MSCSKHLLQHFFSTNATIRDNFCLFIFIFVPYIFHSLQEICWRIWNKKNFMYYVKETKYCFNNPLNCYLDRKSQDFTERKKCNLRLFFLMLRVRFLLCFLIMVVNHYYPLNRYWSVFLFMGENQLKRDMCVSFHPRNLLTSCILCLFVTTNMEMFENIHFLWFSLKYKIL